MKPMHPVVSESSMTEQEKEGERRQTQLYMRIKSNLNWKMLSLGKIVA